MQCAWWHVAAAAPGPVFKFPAFACPNSFLYAPPAVPTRGEVALSALRVKYRDILSRVNIGGELNVVFASDALVGGVFPDIVEAVRDIPVADRIMFVQFLIELKERSNSDYKCKKCARRCQAYFCDKCNPRRKCRTCAGDAFLYAEKCLICAAAHVYF